MKKEQTIKILLKHKVLTNEQLHKVDEEIKRTGLSFSKALAKMRIIGEKELIQLISEEIGIPFVDISSYLIDREVAGLVPQKIARKHKMIPLFKIDNVVTLAMVNPKNVLVLDEVKQITGIENIETVLSTEEMISEAIENYYVEEDKIDEIIKDRAKTEKSTKTKKEEEHVKEINIIKIVNLVFLEGIKARASDIHIEPHEDGIRLRYRIDGVLSEVNSFPKHIQSAVISRIKIMADMDIAESRLPQDGRIALKIEDKDLDVRVSSFPTVYGENIVMRLLDKTSVLLGLDELGFLKDDFARFEKLIHSPFGIILVTGPTGSGKTTTLYAILAVINSIKKNIITIEDPIEYRLPLIRQTQVNSKAGLTFASGLRAILRQDPDIIMVGEIRDLETAEVAIQAALTGHLVFATLHTNDASSAVTRLMDMGVEPFLISSTLIGVLAQRLVRVICKDCKEKYRPSPDIVKSLSSYKIKDFYRGKGCPKCKNTGFLGRNGIFEFLAIDEILKEKILKRASSEELKKAAVSDGMRTLYKDGIKKVKKGITSIEDVLRVAKSS